MFTQDQVLAGLVQYIKKELIPILPSYAKVLGGAALLKNAQRLPQIMEQLTGGSMAKTLGIVEDGGQIDVDLWCQNIKQSIREFGDGRLTIELPWLNPLYINENDIDTVKRYIKGELK